MRGWSSRVYKHLFIIYVTILTEIGVNYYIEFIRYVPKPINSISEDNHKFGGLSITKLKKIVKERGIKGTSKAKKEQLLEMFNNNK